MWLYQGYFAVKIDGTQIRSIENTDPRTFENVQVFVGDSFHDPANAKLRNLVYEFLLEGWYLK